MANIKAVRNRAATEPNNKHLQPIFLTKKKKGKKIKRLFFTSRPLGGKESSGCSVHCRVVGGAWVTKQNLSPKMNITCVGVWVFYSVQVMECPFFCLKDPTSSSSSSSSSSFDRLLGNDLYI